MEYLEILEKLQVASSNYNKAKRNKKVTELTKCRAMLKYRDEIRTLKKQKEYIKRVLKTYKVVIYRAYLMEHNPSKLPILFEDYKIKSNYDFAEKILNGFKWGTNERFNPDDEFIVENKELGFVASLSKCYLIKYYKAITDNRDVLQYTSKYYAQLDSFMLTCEFSRFLKKPLNKIKGFENAEGIPTVEDFFEDDYYQAEDLLKIVAATFEEGYKAKNEGEKHYDSEIS